MKLLKNDEMLLQVSQLIEYAFNKSRSIIADPVFLSRYQQADCYGIVQDKQLTSLVMANHFPVQFYDKEIPMAGIGYVSSYPEYRGNGDIKKTMVEMIQDLYKQGVLISSLAPFSQSFYRKFGYEQTSWQKNYRIPTQALQYLVSETSGTWKRGTWSDERIQGEVKKLHQEKLSTGQEVGTVHREDWWWYRLDSYYSGRHIVIAYNEAKQAEGYMIYRMTGSEIIVDEMLYQTNFAMRKLLSYLKGHQSSFESISYQGNLADQLESAFTEQEAIAINTTPYMMSRIIDFSQVLALIPFLKDPTSYIFNVSDDQCGPWNVGKWQLVKTAKGLSCQKVSAAIEADMTMTIEGWAELILGTKTVEELVFQEKLVTTKLTDIKDLFPQGRQSFYDYF
ncbi:GNAT family N-acetyltransferase [Vagococcus coleopterorum]|uniref:GNAT family N-acetyltransferase n=1 Tax=Vagococcus coleopterorum TaxID=2714946 RepID=A0A6G8AKJ7_9ENTE|nr:GNAT family N-acetyltransferase [Vagococcus coleopterorum]QIL45614.1 GNAT family N-acetyltransferase [Vagococcus coleopterorum]